MSEPTKTPLKLSYDPAEKLFILTWRVDPDPRAKQLALDPLPQRTRDLLNAGPALAERQAALTALSDGQRVIRGLERDATRARLDYESHIEGRASEAALKKAKTLADAVRAAEQRLAEAKAGLPGFERRAEAAAEAIRRLCDQVAQEALSTQRHELTAKERAGIDAVRKAFDTAMHDALADWIVAGRALAMLHDADAEAREIGKNIADGLLGVNAKPEAAAA